MLQLPEHQLIQECITRWGSTLAMLDRLLEQQAAIAAVLIEGDSKHRYLMPDNDEWTLIESLVTVLRPFQKATEMMSTAKYPSLSTIQPLLYMLVNQTLATADDDSRAILSVKKAIKDDLICRYTSPQLKGLLDLSTYLDCRYSSSVINYIFFHYTLYT